MSAELKKRRDRVTGKGQVIEAARRFDPAAQPELADWNAERAVIGAPLLKPQIFPALAAILQAGDFFGVAEGFIWHAYEELTRYGDPIDFLSVADFLDAEGKCELKGAALVERLTKTANACPDPDNGEFYAKKVREAALRGRVISAAFKIIQQSQDRSIQIDELVETCNAEIFKATEQYFDQRTGIRDLTSHFYDVVEDAAAGKSGGLPTGFKTLDTHIGYYPKEVTVLAGGAGMGKTTWILSSIRRLCMMGKRVALFTLEMSASEDVMRALLAVHTGIAKRALKHGDLTPAQRALFTKAVGEVSEWPLDVIDEFQNLTPTQLRRKLSYLKTQGETELVVIDGLWLMQPDEMSKDGRWRDVTNIMRALNQVAVDYNVPIVITHQYKDVLDDRPRLSDLAESRGVDRNAQVVMGMYRDSYQFGDVANPAAEIHILKDRNGDGTGKMVDIIYDGCGYREVGDGTA